VQVAEYDPDLRAAVHVALVHDPGHRPDRRVPPVGHQPGQAGRELLVVGQQPAKLDAQLGLEILVRGGRGQLQHGRGGWLVGFERQRP